MTAITRKCWKDHGELARALIRLKCHAKTPSHQFGGRWRPRVRCELRFRFRHRPDARVRRSQRRSVADDLRRRELVFHDEQPDQDSGHGRAELRSEQLYVHVDGRRVHLSGEDGVRRDVPAQVFRSLVGITTFRLSYQPDKQNL